MRLCTSLTTPRVGAAWPLVRTFHRPVGIQVPFQHRSSISIEAFAAKAAILSSNVTGIPVVLVTRWSNLSFPRRRSLRRLEERWIVEG
jgi:hypothetical protein